MGSLRRFPRLQALGRVVLCVLGLIGIQAPRAVGAENDAGSPTANWLLTVGSYGIYAPRFEGSKQNAPDWRPILSFRGSDAREWLTLPNDGFDLELIETSSFRLGPVVNWRLQRHVDTTCLGCRHFGSVDLSIEAGVFAEFWPKEWWRTRVEVRAAAIGGDGFVADLSSDVVWKISEAMLVTAGPRLSIADRSFMQSYYGIGPAEGLALTREPFEPKGGLRSYGIGTHVKYKFENNWAALGFLEWQHLAGSASETPRIEDRGSIDSVIVGFGLSYTFAFKQ